MKISIFCKTLSTFKAGESNYLILLPVIRGIEEGKVQVSKPGTDNKLQIHSY